MTEEPAPKLAKIRRHPTEKGLWQRISPLLHTTKSRAYRIEAINTPGFPDVVWITQKGKGGNYVWLIELKAGPLYFRPVQVKFIEENYRIGVPVYVIWQRYINDPVMVYHGMDLSTNYTGARATELTQWITEQTT